MKERYCYNCNKPLKWLEFVECNFNLAQDHLEHIWEEDRVALYCCDCFKEINLLNRNGMEFEQIMGKLVINKIDIVK